ncbi:MAG: LysR family transcriptional regulator [Paraglaciecola sp.]|nr:LysR family transcriptional regulator [Paraglaciecola sp.]
MISSDDLQLITVLAQEKSLVGVSRILNVSASAISQRLGALENKLDLKIAERVGRSGIILSAEGNYLASRGKDILNDISLLNDDVFKRKGQLTGELHVIASMGFGRLYIAPMLARFEEIYPEVKIKLTLSDQLGRIPNENWDILIRVEPLRDSTLRMKKLASNKRILCASPDYIARFGEPVRPHDLTQHQCITIFEDNEDTTLWRFSSKNGDKEDTRISPHFSCNDGEVALSWALAGKGIILRSEWSVTSHIRSGKLIPLLSKWFTQEAPIIALTNGPKKRTERVQRLLDYLYKEVGIIISKA